MRFWKIFLLFVPFWLAAFTFKVGGGLHYTLLPTLGEKIFPVWLVGVLIGGFALVQMVYDVPAGYLLDRYGYLKLVKFGTFCFFLSGIILLLGLGSWTYFLTLTLSSAGWLFFSPGVDAYILVSADKKFAGKFIALRDMMESGGIVVGMGLLALVVHFPTPILGLIIAAIMFLTLVFLFRAPAEPHVLSGEKKLAHQSFYIRRHFLHHVIISLKKLNPASSLLMLLGFSAATFYGIVWFVVPLLIAQAVSSGVLSFGLMMFDLSVLFVGFILGELTDRWSKQWLVFWGLLLFGITAFLLGFNFGWLFLVFGFLATSGDEMSSISLWA